MMMEEKLNMDYVLIEPSLALRVPANLAIRKQIIPISSKDEKVYVACVQNDIKLLGVIQRYFKLPIEAKLAEEESLRRAIHRVYGNLHHASQKSQTPALSKEASIILVDQEAEKAIELSEELLRAAILKKASDIHIVPDEQTLQIRLRVDGKLEDYRELPKSYQSSLVSRFKVLSNLDIAEKRAPQDGGFGHHYGALQYDVRVAILPTPHGERITLRFLAMDTESLTLSRLGMSDSHLEGLQNLLHSTSGLVLLSGPTGSGKTTTLYATIRELLKHEKLNIITVEDPIEYRISGITQVKVDSHDKITFSKALRSLLRHDPDVVVIGEIRDEETAYTAIKASLTGHLVFSTIHTNSVSTVVTRLVDIGIPRYLIGAVLKAVIAQRLVRRYCSFCKKSARLSKAQAELLHVNSKIGETIYEPGGCIYCRSTGYSGRLGLFEMLFLDEFWSRLIIQGANENELVDAMKEKKIPFLLEDGFHKITQGLTSVEEVFQAVVI